MRHDTALTICPDYPPQDLERLPHYEGRVSTPEENRAVFQNLWQQGEALLHGDMALYRRDMRLTTNTFNNTVIGRLVQSQAFPTCGFHMKMAEETASASASLRIEIDKIQEENNRAVYVRRRINLQADGSATAQSLRQGLADSCRLVLQNDRQYDPVHELTTEELRELDDLYVYINMQHETQSRQPSLRRYIGSRAVQTWRYLTD